MWKFKRGFVLKEKKKRLKGSLIWNLNLKDFSNRILKNNVFGTNVSFSFFFIRSCVISTLEGTRKILLKEDTLSEKCIFSSL